MNYGAKKFKLDATKRRNEEKLESKSSMAELAKRLTAEMVTVQCCSSS
jgi:hypothetical protein